MKFINNIAIFYDVLRFLLSKKLKQIMRSSQTQNIYEIWVVFQEIVYVCYNDNFFTLFLADITKDFILHSLAVASN